MDWKNNFPKIRRFYETESVIVYQGDCFSLMRLFPDKIFDLILTSPPFLDKEVPKPYYTFIKEFINLAMKKTKWMFMFNSAMRLIDICKMTNPRFVMVWNKVFTMSAYRYEPIFVYTDSNESIWGRGKIFNTLFSYKVELNKDKKRHINENPVKLYEDLLKLKASADLICDPFAGSGTTAVAGCNLGKRVVCIEIEKDYCEIIKQRVIECHSQRISNCQLKLI